MNKYWGKDDWGGANQKLISTTRRAAKNNFCQQETISALQFRRRTIFFLKKYFNLIL